ncbi:hypothetical protein VPH35_048100 [Triticum aestivum]
MNPTLPDLPPELVREISGRLHDVADFVRFHAVCKPWRDSHHPTTTRTTHQFLPWLLAHSKKGDDSLNFICVFSNTSYRAPLSPPISGNDGQMNRVASADGTAIRYFTASPDGPTLHNPLGGGPLTNINMPLFPEEDVNGEFGENPNGILYNNGEYRKHDSSDDDTAEFKAALLCPGNDEWTFVKRTLESPNYSEFCVAYHAGKILVTHHPQLHANSDQVLLPKLSWMPREHDGRYYEYSYVLESHGELLWVSVHIKMDYLKESSTSVCDLVQALSMSVHTLEEVTKGPEKLRWVRKVGRSLADRVLFLGWPNSFAVDASRLGVSGGLTYFLFYDNHRLRKRRGVFRYNLIDNMTELIEWLPQGWDNEMCAWLVPQPTIAPIDRGPATTPRINNMIHIERCYGLLSRVFVRNLPLDANDSQLQQLFSKYGRVSCAKVTYYKKTKTSRGLVTMATMHVCHDDAFAALDGLILDGCRLEVISVKGRQ